MKEGRINFACVVIEWMLEKVNNFNLPTFKVKDRQRRESKSYASHFTRIFKHFRVNLEGFESYQVLELRRIIFESLRGMKLYETVGRGYVFQYYLRAGDVRCIKEMRRECQRKRKWCV